MCSILFGSALLYVSSLGFIDLLGVIFHLWDSIAAAYIWFGGLGLGSSIMGIIFSIGILFGKIDL